MARLPSKFDLSGPVSLRSGRPIASWDQSGAARGLAAAGNALEGLGDDMLRQEARARREGIVLEGTAADGGAMKELSDFERGFDADADYGTFGPRFEKGATTIRDKWARTINDPKARQAWSLEFDKGVLSGRNRVLDLGNRRIREGKLVNAKTGLEGYQSVLADPDAAADVRAKATKDADASIAALQGQGLLTPSEADDWRDKIIKGGEFVLGQREIERNPEIITGKLPSNVSERAGLAMGYFQKHGLTKEQAAGIVGNLLAESSLNTGARNAGDGRDGSDSIGIGQWNSTRARALMKFAGERGKDWRDFETQLAFVVHELDGSHKSIGDRLRAAKDLKEATHAGIMFEGPAGSQNGPENAMHYDKRMKLAAQAAGETIKPDWYTNQTPDNQLRLENMAVARQGEIERDFAAQRKIEHDTTVDDYRLRIATGDAGLLPGDILGDTRIDAGDKATLITSYSEKNKERIQTAADIQSFVGGGLTIDPYESDGRKRADNVFDAAVAGISTGDGATIDPGAARRYISEEMVRQAGVVPKTVFNGIRAGVSSTSVPDVVAALQEAQRIAAINPAALGRRDGGAELQTSVDDFKHYVDDLNLSPQEAAQRIMDARDPTKKRDRKALEPVAKAFIKEMEEVDLADAFDEGALSSEPALGFNPQQAAGIRADFLALAEDQFYRANGDPAIAQARAMEQMKRMYGVTRLTGEPVVMKHPPERYWPAMRGTSDPLGYARDQLRMELDAANLFEGYDRDSIQLITVPETDADVKAGRMPGYAVTWKDKNGVIQSFPGKLWRPNIKAVEAGRQRIEDEARKEQTQQRQIAPYMIQTPQDFLSGNDPVSGAR